MANNKVELSDGTILIDLTGDTVAPEVLMQGYTAHDRSGAAIVGTATGGGDSINPNLIQNGLLSINSQANIYYEALKSTSAVDCVDFWKISNHARFYIRNGYIESLGDPDYNPRFRQVVENIASYIGKTLTFSVCVDIIDPSKIQKIAMRSCQLSGPVISTIAEWDSSGMTAGKRVYSASFTVPDDMGSIDFYTACGSATPDGEPIERIYAFKLEEGTASTLEAELAFTEQYAPREIIPSVITAGDTPVMADMSCAEADYGRNLTDTGISLTVQKAGTYRFKSDALNTYYSSSSIYRAAIQFYKNGTAHGNMQIISPSSEITYTQDIQCNAGDIITVYASSGNSTYKVRAFTLVACIDWNNGF